MSYAHRESPSRETGASTFPFINESTVEVEDEESSKTVKKEEEKRQTAHEEEDRK